MQHSSRNYESTIYISDFYNRRLELWCLMPLSTIAVFQLYRGDKFYWWRQPEYP